jgi:hypothetical protein
VEVPLTQSKLYGGQQLERLLAEFLVISARSEIAEPSLADVANAAGVNKVRYAIREEKRRDEEKNLQVFFLSIER